MPLAPVLKFPSVLDLVPSSGIQLVDLGFGAGRSAGGRDWWEFHEADGEMPVRMDGGGGGAACEVDLGKIAEIFDGAWMPVPMFREEPGGDCYRGPTNWARVRLTKLEEPDEDGFDHRITAAFDTGLLPQREDEAYLAPSEEDARRGATFSLCRSEEALDWFVREEWVAGWIREAFRDMVTAEEARRRPSAGPATDRQVEERLESPREDVARYKALVYLLAERDLLPKVKVLDCFTEPAPTPIDVDLVLDVGNSRTCGMLIETHPDEVGANVTQAVKIRLRDLSEPGRVYDDPFESRIEFNRARFGKDEVSLRSGRPAAFSWPTVVRIGPEAQRLAGRRRGSEGATGSSSPKRYLWDDDPRRDSWRFNDPVLHGEDAPTATGVAFTTLVNDTGEPLHKVPESVPAHGERRLPSFQALYARRNLMSFALSEALLQTIVMMNSAAHRLQRRNAGLPRRLRRIVMTMPTALPLEERRILRAQAENARDLAYLCLYPGRPGEDGAARLAALREREGISLPEIRIDWDEASATQAVYLYSQTAVAWSGDAHAFFGRSRLPLNRNSDPDYDFRLATLDMGGGTTDLVVTGYKAEGRGANVTLFPEQIFREGMSVAGDDVAFRLIREQVLDAVRAKMEESGLDGDRAAALMDRLFGGDRGEMHVEEQSYRRHFAAHVGMPAALRLIAGYERWDPLSDAEEGEAFDLREMASGRGAAEAVFEHVNRQTRQAGGAGFDLARVELPVRYREVDRTVRSVVLEMLQAFAEIVYRTRADVLILSGRPSRMPAVEAILKESMALPPHRVIPLHRFQVGSWYPFRDHALAISDPKTTAAVGAMICLLGEGRLRNFNLRSDRLKARATARFFGKLDRDNRLREDDTYYRGLDLEDEDYRLSEEPFEFRGPMVLGFRQLGADWWPGTRLYDLDYADAEAAARLNPRTPLQVVLQRSARGEHRDVVDAFRIERVLDHDGRTVRSGDLRLRLQTIDHQDGYWLDTGILLNR